jgi:hypothetical protein
MRQAADEPEGPLTKKRSELRSSIRSLHVRYARRSAAAGKVRRQVHVLYYRVAQGGVIAVTSTNWQPKATPERKPRRQSSRV